MEYSTSVQMLEDPTYSGLCDDHPSLYGSFTSSLLTPPTLPSFNQTFSSPYSPGDCHALQTWTTQHPDHWSSREVLNWIYDVIEKHDLDASRISGEKFQDVTGYQLCRMSREEFLAREPNFGDYIYGLLQSLLQGASFSEPDNLPMLNNTSYLEDTFTDISNSTCTEEGIKVLIGTDLYDIDVTPIDIPGLESSIYEPYQDPGYWSESGSDMDRDSDCLSERTDCVDMDIFYNDIAVSPKSRTFSDSQFSDTLEELEAPVKPRPSPKQTNRGRPPGQGSKGNHLWEFIRDTLKDPKFNPTLLKWENKEEGVFRFVQSEAVAQMWGRKKNNTGMTYEKLSRAMRFCRSTGFFAALPKTGKYPKKLCFKFGAKAFGWQN